MAEVYHNNIIDIDLESGTLFRSFLNHTIGSGDNNANWYGVRVFRKGEPIALSGCSVQGLFMPASGAAILISDGTHTWVSGNEAAVLLPQACYNVKGRFTLTIKIIGTNSYSITDTVRIIDGVVADTYSENPVAPTAAVPTYQEILAVYNQMVAAKEGSVRFDIDQTLTAAQMTQARGNIEAASAAEVSDLKSALNYAPNMVDSDAEDVDLDITDYSGNVILRLADGHIKTKEFDSSAINVEGTKAEPTNADEGIFDITDGDGNVILRLENGYIKTQKTDNTNPFEVPSYYFPYIDQKCNRIKTLLEASGGDAFIFCTDQHFNQGNAGNAFRLINYVADNCRINKLFMGGDLTDGWDAEHSDQFRRAIGGKYYYINGNHEYMKTGATPEILAYTNEATDDNLMMGDALRNYYYVDNPKKQMRYIVLNGFNSTGTTWQRGYEADQLTWLNDVAMDIPDGWHIIVLSHIFYSVTAMDNPALVRVNWAEPVLTAIDTNANSSSVLCILCGHTHVDSVKSTDGGIPILITTCDKNKPYNPNAGYEWWITDRDDGTVKEQAFDVCVVDLTHSKITAVRIGGFTTGDTGDDEELFGIGERVINL